MNCDEFDCCIRDFDPEELSEAALKEVWDHANNCERCTLKILDALDKTTRDAEETRE